MASRADAIFAGALGLLLALAAFSVHAQDLDARWMKQTSATSDCIGNPSSPLCALDTYLACIVRARVDMCATVGFGKYKPTAQPHESEEVEYRVVSGKVLRVKDGMQPSVPPEYGVDFEVIELVVHQRNYSDKGQWPDDGWWLHAYEFFPTGDSWEIWTSYTGGDEEPPFWEWRGCKGAPDGIFALCEANVFSPYGGPFINP